MSNRCQIGAAQHILGLASDPGPAHLSLLEHWSRDTSLTPNWHGYKSAQRIEERRLAEVSAQLRHRQRPGNRILDAVLFES